MPSLRFVSTNPGKFREVRSILAEFGVTVSWLRRELPEPQADSLEEVLGSKLRALPAGRATYLVEDSGLFVDALGGFPGVYSAYVYRTIGLAGILRLLEGRPRSAVFRTAAGVRTGATSWTVRGATRGAITDRPSGRNGFGYDPIFRPAGSDRTFAELSPDEKNRLSHRARAVRRVGARLALGRPRARQM